MRIRRRVWPNPSLKRSANGRPPSPVWRYVVHCRQPGPWRPAVGARLARTLGVMTSHRASVIETAVSDSGLPEELARRLIAEAPWLDGTDEVSEELAPELLAEDASAFGVSQSKLREFIERYNTLVCAEANPYVIRQSEACVLIGQALLAFGKADAFGNGDYWVVEDSFSTKSPVVMLFDQFRLPDQAIAKLQQLLNQYSGVFSELRINTEYGAELQTLHPR
jgi:hypothetical protein